MVDLGDHGPNEANLARTAYDRNAESYVAPGSTTNLGTSRANFTSSLRAKPTDRAKQLEDLARRIARDQGLVF
jgi:hypothetical protein